MKFVVELTPEEKETLSEAYRNHPSFRVRQRSQALLLSNRHYSIVRLCELFEVRHETVSSCLDAGESQGLMALYDSPRSGRPATFTADEQSSFLGYVDENPHQPKVAATRLQEETSKKASLDTFRRVLKKVPTSGNVAANRRKASAMRPPSSVTGKPWHS